MTNLAIAHAIKLKPLLILAGIAYGVLVGALWGWQNRLIFEPQTELPYTPEDYNLSYLDVNIPVGAGSLHGWWIEGGKPVLLFLHGNSGNVSTNLPQAVRFVRLGFSVLMVDYRGYGISAGEQPSEQRVYEDAEAAYRSLLDEGIAPRDIFIYGHSLGGAVAVELASRIKNAAGLILESTFTLLTDVARIRFPFLPAERILQHRFDSLAKRLTHASRDGYSRDRGRNDSFRDGRAAVRGDCLEAEKIAVDRERWTQFQRSR